MRLKKLKLVGFKSFAEKITLDFDASIVGIVGPNGCGKSNIVDAFRWVMGEQSAKSMRGEKMHDLLFAGTAKRPPLNYAEVSVTLSDVGEKLPIAYEEVQITRRLHRSGESEYLLNNNPIRLKELHHLFMGSGIGKNAFSIFEQGKLDQIIHLNPTERRAIFDESAGIGRFLHRKKESMRNLQQVSDNFHRVKDVHAEVEKQYRVLKRQAMQAKNYRDNKEKLEALEKAILVARYNSAQAVEEEGYREVVQELQELQKDVCSKESEIAAEKEVLAEREEQTRSEREAFYQARNRIEIQKVERRRLSEKIEERQKSEKRRLEERALLQKKQKSCHEQLLEKQKSFEEVEKQRIDQKELNGQKNESFQEIETALQELLEAQKEGQKNRLQVTQAEGELSTKLQQIKTRQEACKERVKQLQEELSSKKTEIARLERAQKEKKQKVTLFSKDIEEREKELQSVRDEIKTTLEKVESKQQDLENVLEEITQLAARERSLIRLREEFEGFSKGAKELLREGQKKGSALFGKVQGLFHHLTPKKGEEKQTAQALHAYAHTLVVQTEADLHEVILFAAKKQWTDFSLLCLGHLRKGTCQAHFLKELFLTDSLQKALHHVGKKGALEAATADGYFIDHRHVLFCGGEKSQEGDSFLREVELKELAGQLRTKREKRDRLQANFETLATQRKKLKEKAKQLEEKRRKEEMNLVEANFLLQSLLADVQREKESQLSLAEEEKKVRCQEKELEKERLSLAKKLSETVKKGVSVFEEIQAVEKRLQKLQQSWNAEVEGKREREERLRAIEARAGALMQDMEIIAALQKEISDTEKRVKEELERSQNEAKEYAAHAEELTQEKPLDIEELKQELELKEKQLTARRKQFDQLSKSISKAQQEVATLEKKQHSLELGRAEKASLRKAIEEDMHERFNLSIDEATEQCGSLENSIEESQKIAIRLRYEIEKAGAVNMASIDEFKEQEKRTHFLHSQLKDLEEAKKDLERVISKLEVESRKIFKKSFAQIREKFQKNFQILFEGGEADLAFTGSPDVLEAGVEITAKPPGKQMRSISLLSGGEKCLTALALLFAIFEVKPAPFCILDEVDAPLDDSNIDRFTNILGRFVDKTQFILVTHNKKTMAIADILFGVSMEEKGISKLLSLTFEKEKTKEKVTQ